MTIGKKFKKISTINPSDRATWEDSIFLTFDIDWAHDDVIFDCYGLVSKYSVQSTWFVTHKTKVLDIFALDANLELGIHPNFNAALVSGQGQSCGTIIRESKELVPAAACVRSHSLVQSEKLIDQFLHFGLTRCCNLFIPYSSAMAPSPFALWNGAVMIPHRFQDNASLRLGEEFPNHFMLQSGFHVFDFHPIHVFLNTESLDRYERTRHLHKSPNELIKYRYDGYGTRSRLIELLEVGNIR